MKGVQSRAVNERHNRVYPTLLRGGAHTRLPVPQSTCAPPRSFPNPRRLKNIAEISYLRSNFGPILPAKNSRCSSRTLSEGPLSQLTHRGPSRPPPRLWGKSPETQNTPSPILESPRPQARRRGRRAAGRTAATFSPREEGGARPSQFCRRRRTLRRRGDTSVAASSGCVVARWLLIDTVMRSRDASPSRGPPANGMGLTLCQRSPFFSRVFFAS